MSKMAEFGSLLQPIWLWGTTGALTRAVLARLLAAQVPLAGLVIPGADAPAPHLMPPPLPDPHELPLVDAFVQPTALQLAWGSGLPVYGVGRLDAGVAAWLAAHAPALVVVACFPRRIPASLLAIPRMGFLNVHPSRLPHYRGPAPLFWQLRANVQPLGVTVHQMDAEFDTGPIVAQAAVARPDGATGPELDALLGTAGGALVVAALRGGLPAGRPQPEDGSYHSWPAAADFTLDPGWSSQHVYNFVCGTTEWGRPYALYRAGQRWRVDRVLGWDPEGTLPAPVVVHDGLLEIQCRPGWVRAVGGLWP